MDSGRKQVKPGSRPKVAAKAAARSPASQGNGPAKPAAASAPTLKKGGMLQGLSLTALQKAPGEATVGILRKILLIETMMVFVLALAFCYAKFNIPSDPIPFAVTTDGKPKRLVALPGPTQTQQALMSWVGSASADILNFGFHNVYDRLDSTRKYFTDEGWESFVQAVKESEIITRITEKQQVITAAPIGTPVILKTEENIKWGKQWTVQVPIYVTILSGKATDSKKRTLTLVLVSVPPAQNLSGLGIDRWLESN